MGLSHFPGRDAEITIPSVAALLSPTIELPESSDPTNLRISPNAVFLKIRKTKLQSLLVSSQG
jgi:hypothetical protein